MRSVFHAVCEFVGDPIHVLPDELVEVYAHYPHTPDVTRALIHAPVRGTSLVRMMRKPYLQILRSKSSESRL
jgi:hypothetical protein